MMYREEKPFIRRFVEHMDWLLVASTAALIIIGLIMVYSSTLHFGNPGIFFAKQIFAITVGLLGLIILLGLNYQFYAKEIYTLYTISILMLVLVLFFGVKVRGTRGWFNLGYFAFQPVEITKIIFILVISAYLDKHWRYVKRWQTLVVPILLLLGNVLLILVQPDFSSTLVYFPVTIVLLYAAGAEPLYLLWIVMFGGLAVGIPLLATFFKLQPALLKVSPVLSYLIKATSSGFEAFIVISIIIGSLFFIWWFINKLRINIPFAYLIILSIIIILGSVSSAVVQKSLKEYQRKRLIVFLNPDIDPLGSGYNIIQSKIAIGAGRFIGKGLFSGTQTQLGFLPEQHTDFIFSVIGEETGFLFSAFTIALYFLLIWRALLVAHEARDRHGSLIAIGIATMFAFYAVINVGMVMGLMPATGLPLPLLSYGGSSIVSSLWAIGILFSIHIRRFTH